MNLVRFLRAASLALAVFVCCSVVYAQSDLGSISGFVKDPSGAVVPAAQVTVKNEATGTERTANTNESGYYTVTNIPAGLYTVTAEAKGFKKFETSHNKLDPSAALAVDLALTVGAATETVEVSATAEVLQTESATRESLVTREQIDLLELNGRNPVGLAALAPGARPGNASGLSFGMSQGPSNFNGSRNPENLTTYDGAPAVRTRSNGSAIGAADVDSTQEVQILTAAYAAEYGRTSGAQIRIITRAGSQDFHGAAYEYIRNNHLNANTWARNHTPDIPGLLPNSSPLPFQYNQFGYNIGGPVYIPGKFNADKSKFFFYFGQEWVRLRQFDTATWTVPTLLMRQGNFSEMLTNNPVNIQGKVVQLLDPTTKNPIPGNLIPVTLQSQNGLGILKAYPAPDIPIGIAGGSNNYYVTAKAPQNQRKETFAFDLNLTDKQRLQARKVDYAFFQYQPLDGTPTRTPKFFNRPNQTNSLDHVWTISPTKVNEVLATFSLDDVYIPVDTANFFDRTAAGINYPYIFPTGKLIPTRIPTANISGLTGLTGGPYPSHSTGPIYTITDSFTWVKNSHTFKAGFYYEKSGENDNDEINVSACPTCTNNQNGQFTFTDTRSGAPSSSNAIGNTAMGIFDSYSELGQRAYTIFRGASFEPYVQDSWKVSQKLTVNMGFRYTVIVPYHALWGNMIAFDPALYDPAKAVTVKNGVVIVGSGADRYNGMVIPGDNAWPSSAVGRFPEATAGTFDYLHRGGSYPNYFSNVQWGQIQPRFGFAYKLNEKTVVRAGGGEFFTRLGVSDSVFLGGNPPFQPTANVTFGNADNPGGTSANSLPLTVTTQSRAFKNPSAWNWNIVVERELPWKSTIQVGYVGRRGLHLQRESNINQPTPGVVAAAPAGTNLDDLRPYKGYNSIRETDNVASSLYHGLQLQFTRRFSNGLHLQAVYTLSKAWDNGSNQRDIIPDTYYAGNLWGPSEFDTRHVFISNFLYELPFFKDKSHVAGKVLGGWQVSGLIQYQSGTPTSVGRGTDYAGVGVDGSLAGGIGNYWVFNNSNLDYQKTMAHDSGNTNANWWVYPFNESGCSATGTGCTLKWTVPDKGTFNHQPGIRDMIYNPGFENWNLGLFKKFALNERAGFQFRAEAFDAFNHPNWNGVGTDPTNLTTFMKVTSKSNDVRNLQLSLRFYF
ncbi:MAG: carboxypeptidase regulatory-like domain-containing protein [Acidobacteriia bacterium]|nr:carboxypeptidase regulatory-like domain-containing protein [Terriglobia bacterium]